MIKKSGYVVASAVSMMMLSHAVPFANADRTWDGGGADNNWATVANWNPDGVPSAENAFINGGTYNVLLNSAVSNIVAMSVGGSGTSSVVLNIQAGASVTQNNGNLTVGSSVNTAVGAINMTGGSLTEIRTGATQTFTVNAFGTVEISGGSLSYGFDFVNTGTFRVVGSGATTVQVATRNFTLNSASVVDFRLDNGGVTPIKSTRTAAGTDQKLDGTLKVGFKAGVALTASNNFKLLDFAKDTTGSFASVPSSTLWTITPASSSNSFDLVASYAAGANKGTLSKATGPVVTTFGASSTGDVIINDLTLASTVDVYLAADAGSGKTVADLISYFNGGGLSATSASADGFNVKLSFLAGSATSYFGWDLSDFNAGATLSAVAVPEPVTGFAWLVATGYGLTRRWTRRSNQTL